MTGGYGREGRKVICDLPAWISGSPPGADGAAPFITLLFYMHTFPSTILTPPCSVCHLFGLGFRKTCILVPSTRLEKMEEWDRGNGLARAPPLGSAAHPGEMDTCGLAGVRF